MTMAYSSQRYTVCKNINIQNESKKDLKYRNVKVLCQISDFIYPILVQGFFSTDCSINAALTEAFSSSIMLHRVFSFSCIDSSRLP